jgi:protein-S-isoprenylcysteine O-methyltransferase Ste14
MQAIAGAVITGTWVVWALVWLVGAVLTARSGPRRRIRVSSGSASVTAFVVAVVAGWVVPAWFWRDLRVTQPWVRITGLVILVAGLAFTLWARRALGLMWTSAPSVKADHELRTDGPYRITRHPIYTGMLGMLLGTSLASGLGSAVLLAPVGLAIFLIKMRAEERLMTETFPDAYPRYRRDVPGLVPRLRRHSPHSAP